MRRAVFVAVGLVVLGWLLLPIPRAYFLLIGRHSEPHAPPDLALSEVRFTAADGILLAGWLLPASTGRPAVVLVHGLKSSRAEMLPWARFLHEAGYNVLLFDTRGCGRSGGSTVGMGASEPRDIVAAVGTAVEAFRATKVGVLGISLGAGAAILAASADPRIAAVVADSAWIDQNLTLSRLSFVPLGALRLPIPPYGVTATNALIGADVTKARPLEVIGRIAPRPVLLIHSGDDDVETTTPDGARALYAAAGDPKELWIAPRGGHIGAINAFPEEYRARVLAFLANALR